MSDRSPPNLNWSAPSWSAAPHSSLAGIPGMSFAGPQQSIPPMTLPDTLSRGKNVVSEMKGLTRGRPSTGSQHEDSILEQLASVEPASQASVVSAANQLTQYLQENYRRSWAQSVAHSDPSHPGFRSSSSIDPRTGRTIPSLDTLDRSKVTTDMWETGQTKESQCVVRAVQTEMAKLTKAEKSSIAAQVGQSLEKSGVDAQTVQSALATMTGLRSL